MSTPKNNWTIGLVNKNIKKEAPQKPAEIMDDQVTANLSKDNCRICLKVCRTTKWPISPAQAHVYQQVTGFKILKTDISVMCCTFCSKFLDDLVAFRKKAVRVEMKLKLARVKSAPTNSLNISLIRTLNKARSQQAAASRHFVDDDDDDGGGSNDVVECSSSPDIKAESDNDDDDDVKTYPCEHCPKPLCFEAWTPEELRKHYKEVHEKAKKEAVKEKSGKNSFMCHICAQQFRTKDFLETHQVKMHNEELKLPVRQCETCLQKFASDRALQNHISERHTE